MNEEGRLLLMLINAMGDAPGEQKVEDFELPLLVAEWYVMHKDEKQSS